LRTRMLMLLVCVGIAGLLGSAIAQSEGGQCVPINGTIQSDVTADGCTSPVGLCTAGNIQAGLLTGTTRFTALSLAFSAGMPGTVEPSTLSYAGDLVITTNQGEIVVRCRLGGLRTLGSCSGGIIRFAECSAALSMPIGTSPALDHHAQHETHASAPPEHEPPTLAEASRPGDGAQ